MYINDNNFDLYKNAGFSFKFNFQVQEKFQDQYFSTQFYLFLKKYKKEITEFEENLNLQENYKELHK